MTDPVRTEIQKLLAGNRRSIENNLTGFFRGWHGDLVASGVNEGDVIDAALVVAVTQAVRLVGPVDAARYLETMIAKLDDFAVSGELRSGKPIH